MASRLAGKRGMLPADPHKIALKFMDYVQRDKLPSLPRSFGHLSGRPPAVPGGWGMLGNSLYGNCVAVGGMHETMYYAMATGRPIPTFRTTWQQNYSDMLVAAGGKPLDPNDRSTDTGLDPQQAAGYRRTVGLLDDAGARHKIDAYALIENIEQAELCIYCFGTFGLGMSLPGTAEVQFNAGQVWDDLRSAPNPNAGHYTPAMALNSRGNLVLSTWATLEGATKAYIERYWSIGIAYLSQEYLTASGKSPELIDWAGLQSDLQEVTQLSS
jgi:hypothetical protein